MTLKDVLFSEEFLFESEDKRDYHGPEQDPDDHRGNYYGRRYQDAPKSRFRDGGALKSHDKFAVNHNPRFADKKNSYDSDGNVKSTRYIKKDDMSKDEEKAYKSALKKTADARHYADKVTKDLDKKYGHDSYEAQTAKDAARRHYRNTHRESAELYEGSIELI